MNADGTGTGVKGGEAGKGGEPGGDGGGGGAAGGGGYATVAAAKPGGAAGGGAGIEPSTATAAIPLCTGPAGGGSLMGNPMVRAISPTAQRLLWRVEDAALGKAGGDRLEGRAGAVHRRLLGELSAGARPRRGDQDARLLGCGGEQDVEGAAEVPGVGQDGRPMVAHDCRQSPANIPLRIEASAPSVHAMPLLINGSDARSDRDGRRWRSTDAARQARRSHRTKGQNLPAIGRPRPDRRRVARARSGRWAARLRRARRCFPTRRCRCARRPGRSAGRAWSASRRCEGRRSPPPPPPAPPGWGGSSRWGLP